MNEANSKKYGSRKSGFKFFLMKTLWAIGNSVFDLRSSSI